KATKGRKGGQVSGYTRAASQRGKWLQMAEETVVYVSSSGFGSSGADNPPATRALSWASREFDPPAQQALHLRRVSSRLIMAYAFARDFAGELVQIEGDG